MITFQHLYEGGRYLVWFGRRRRKEIESFGVVTLLKGSKLTAVFRIDSSFHRLSEINHFLAYDILKIVLET